MLYENNLPEVPCYMGKKKFKDWRETAILEWIYPESLTILLHSNCMSRERTQKTSFHQALDIGLGDSDLGDTPKGGVVNVLSRPRMVVSIFPVMFKAKLCTES